MQESQEASAIILGELTSTDEDVRADYMSYFRSDVEIFSRSMGQALVGWQDLDSCIPRGEKGAYVPALVYISITLHISSMKVFLSGNSVGAGNLFRQAIEAVALAFLCSKENLTFLDRFIDNKYSANHAVRDVCRNAQKLGLDMTTVEWVKQVHKFTHQYSHPTFLTLAATRSLSMPGLYLGGAFDKSKIEAYKKEVLLRMRWAEGISRFIEKVKANMSNSSIL